MITKCVILALILAVKMAVSEEASTPLLLNDTSTEAPEFNQSVTELSTPNSNISMNSTITETGTPELVGGSEPYLITEVDDIETTVAPVETTTSGSWCIGAVPSMLVASFYSVSRLSTQFV